MPKTAEELIVTKLDQLLRAVAIGLTRGVKQAEQIGLLNRAGFPPRDIADLLGTTRNRVNVALTNQRKAERDGKSRRRRNATTVE